MPDSDTKVTDLIQGVDDKLDELDALETEYTVQLIIKVGDAVSPIDAVEQATKSFSDMGFDNFYFAVLKEDSQELTFIQSGMVVDLPGPDDENEA